ncbi:MAG: polysaccharide deacetylase family protein [Campylobacterota bacterium]
MTTRLTVFLTLLLQLFLFAAPRYEIRGESAMLDANMSRFLQHWRTSTTAPIREGNYTNVRLCADCGDTKTVALTFDDSPDENTTFAILDVLKRYDVKASFFMIAAPMNDLNATAVKRAHDEGHLVLNHSFTHPRLTVLPPERLIGEIRTASEKIASITGRFPRLVRPPYGSISRSVVDTLNAEGYTTVLWSLDSLDWVIKDPLEIERNVIANVRPGDIVLMHSSRSNTATAKALGPIIERLRAMGYRFETLDRHLGVESYRDR